MQTRCMPGPSQCPWNLHWQFLVVARIEHVNTKRDGLANAGGQHQKDGGDPNSQIRLAACNGVFAPNVTWRRHFRAAYCQGQGPEERPRIGVALTLPQRGQYDRKASPFLRGRYAQTLDRVLFSRALWQRNKDFVSESPGPPDMGSGGGSGRSAALNRFAGAKRSPLRFQYRSAAG
jgi:hypothetical protein